MLTDSEFLHYALKQHRVPSSARQYLAMIRNSAPARRVGVHARQNVCSEFPSIKMGHTLQTESHAAERAFALLCEYDDRVLEIWDQLQPQNIERTDKNGRKRAGAYFADFALLTTSGPEVVEVKTESDVDKFLSSKHPDWVRYESGEIIHLPAREAFASIGLSHRVFVYKSEMRYLVANLDLMLSSRSAESPVDIWKDRIVGELSKSFTMSLSDLRSRLEMKNYTALIQLIDAGTIHFSIEKDLLSFPDNCFVTLSKELLGHVDALRERGLICAKVGGSAILRDRIPSHYQAERALKKLSRLERGGSDRNVRRWKALIGEGEKIGLTPFQSLLPKNYMSGNRTARINIIVATKLERYLLDEHASLKGISLYRSYIRYRESAINHHPAFSPVTRKTFKSRLDKIPPELIARIRGGNRAANSVVEPTDPEQRALTPQLAWQIGSIDHYLADVYLICVSADGIVYVMRPWVTAMVDRCTSAVLALTISFRSPSRRSCAKVIRECVRRHGRLPREIMVDRGSDFRSVYFAALLASYRVILSFRPAGHGRFGGADIERFFGEFKQQWLSQRPGNLADYREARAVDGAFSPSKSAVLRPADFYREIKMFCQWRDNKCRGIADRSASAKLAEDIADFPFLGVCVNYDQAFIVASAVDSHAYKIDFQRGIHVDGQFYWHPDIALVRGKRRDLEVRIDPENPHAIYALIDKRWVSCSSTKITAYRAKDGVSQFVEGLLIREAATMRAKARMDADENLVRTVREMDRIAIEENSIPAIEISVADKVKNVTSIFKQIKKTSVGSLRRESWSA